MKMKKFIKITLVSLASLFTIILASSFVSSVLDNSVCIESVDGTSLNLSLAAGQVQGMYSLLPEQYRKMLDASYGRFRNRTLSADYDQTFHVDGMSLKRIKGDDGDIYTIAGTIDGLGYHRVSVRVHSQDSFISLMDGIILN